MNNTEVQYQSCVIGDAFIEVNLVEPADISADGKVVTVKQTLVDVDLVKPQIEDLKDALRSIVDVGYVHLRNPKNTFVGAPAPHQKEGE